MWEDELMTVEEDTPIYNQLKVESRTSLMARLGFVEIKDIPADQETCPNCGSECTMQVCRCPLSCFTNPEIDSQ